MLKDITIGQYFPGNSVIHRMDPRFKIVMTLLFIVMLFLGQHLYPALRAGALCRGMDLLPDSLSPHLEEYPGTAAGFADNSSAGLVFCG